MTAQRIRFDVSDLKDVLSSLDDRPLYFESRPNGSWHLFAADWNPKTESWEASTFSLSSDDLCNDCLGCVSRGLDPAPEPSPRPAYWTCIRSETEELFTEAAEAVVRQDPPRNPPADSLESLVHSTAREMYGSAPSDIEALAAYCLEQVLRSTDVTMHAPLPKTNNRGAYRLRRLLHDAADVAARLSPPQWAEANPRRHKDA